MVLPHLLAFEDDGLWRWFKSVNWIPQFYKQPAYTASGASSLNPSYTYSWFSVVVEYFRESLRLRDALNRQSTCLFSHFLSSAFVIMSRIVSDRCLRFPHSISGIIDHSSKPQVASREAEEEEEEEEGLAANCAVRWWWWWQSIWQQITLAKKYPLAIPSSEKLTKAIICSSDSPCCNRGLRFLFSPKVHSASGESGASSRSSDRI